MPGWLLFGGSFNPIHNGHLGVCRHVADRLGVDRIVLIPCANPPHKRGDDLAPAAHRVRMCELAVGGDPRYSVDDWETRQPGPNYTLLTIRHFRGQIGSDLPLYWLIGMDSLRDLPTWYYIGELAAECTLVTAGRPGTPLPDLAPLRKLVAAAEVARIEAHILETPLFDISATDIRERIRRGAPFASLVPDAVAAYVTAQG
ncbi:MAG: nicotinate (nicotinamide) nucleotide adenylyltransferase, partial [Planctomycetes bacterium]|nr:nicotinate (nicotinamide) nucleotide adenylyltransferase [Planctomycetota bacterium]